MVRRRAAGTVLMLHRQERFYNHVIISRDYPKEREESTAASDSGFPFSAGRGLPAELLRPESLPGEFFCGRPESGRNRAYGRAACPARFPFLPRASEKNAARSARDYFPRLFFFSFSSIQSLFSSVTSAIRMCSVNNKKQFLQSCTRVQKIGCLKSKMHLLTTPADTTIF